MSKPFDHIPTSDASNGKRVTSIPSATDAHRELEREFLRIAEQERQRIGQGIHDGLGSLLSGISMMGASLLRDAREGHPIDVEVLEELVHIAREGVDQARALARGLNPVRSEDQNLPAALEVLLNDHETISDTPFDLHAADDLPALTNEVSTQFFWLVREALEGLVWKPGIRRIAVKLKPDEADVILRITIHSAPGGEAAPATNDPSAPHPLLEPARIHMMAYRTELIGGMLLVEPLHDTRLVITCRIPFTQATHTL